MKKLLLWLIVMVISVSMIASFSLVGCKEEAVPAEEVVEEAAPTEKEAEPIEEEAEEVEPAEEAPAELTDITWIAPRGTLEVVDDYYLLVAKELGYFEEMGLNVDMVAAPQGALGDVKFVDQHKADIGSPSPAVIAQAVDQGMDAIIVYEMCAANVFDFAVAKDRDFKFPEDLEGSTISLWDVGGAIVVAPTLVELGIDPESITYIAGGPVWGQAVVSGDADVAFAWEGLRAQWTAIGLDLQWFIGQDFSNQPANGQHVRKSDLEDPAKREVIEKFLKCISMGIYFTQKNPRATAQLIYDAFPAVKEMMEPELCLESLRQLHWLFGYCDRELGAYGMLDKESWDYLLNTIYEMEQIDKPLKFEDVATTELIEAANDFDRARVEADAEAFELDDTWKDIEVTGDWDW